ncbi:hypothetical protein KR093_008449 [Drosophila rubida]|uniref:EGF-like domain-containing protein n=1 Tax=Drosophila rubida TaxID=30044 RepID=A0AAD4K6G2_9MUSC|nr:hypothetical protein KR093_008449 [Drosophila rubida]
MRELLVLTFGLIVCSGAEIRALNASWPVICQPSCDNHATCLPNNICQCFPGYMEQQGVCTPICSYDCGPHGNCIAPDRCGCDASYAWDAQIKRCKAHCSPACKVNEFCSEPDVCSCKPGYVHEQEVCRPQCSRGCGTHGRCVAPETCACFTGYEWNSKLFTCVPKCTPRCGSHSFCHKTNECKCLRGYKPDDGKSLSCSLPLVWWIYLIIALITIVIVCSVAGIIYYFVARGRNVNYYPNSNFYDTNRIVQ